VEVGTGRGKGLGFPTANLKVNADDAIPGDGVYVTKAYIGDRAYSSVSNIGFCPTFGSAGARTVEVYLLDFKGDLYGKELKIEFIERLRDEKKFDSVEQLRSQIAGDVARARSLLL
jgi:riboflavin kinase/FMN adenylyltransferase